MEDGPRSVPAILHPRAEYVNYVEERARGDSHLWQSKKEGASSAGEKENTKEAV